MTRRHYRGEFKATVALAAMREGRTINELAAEEVSAAALGRAKILHSRR